MEQLQQLYSAIDEVQQELAETQPWWPCLSCPVATKRENCCNYSLFLVTQLEWDRMKQSPFIRANRKELKKKARAVIDMLRRKGYPLNDWPAALERYAVEHPVAPCPLLQGGRCQVYEDRPTICRAYGITSSHEGKDLYACSIVDAAVEEHPGARAMPLEDVLTELRKFSTPPAKPIVAWLIEDL